MMERLVPLPAGLVWILSIAAGSLMGQEPDAGDARLQKMIRRAATLKMGYPNADERQPPQLVKSPVLRCSDPTRDEIDGALWLWVDGQRPVAALCMLFYGTAKWNYEHLSLTDEALTVTGRPGWLWRPKAAPRTWV